MTTVLILGLLGLPNKIHHIGKTYLSIYEFGSRNMRIKAQGKLQETSKATNEILNRRPTTQPVLTLRSRVRPLAPSS